MTSCFAQDKDFTQSTKDFHLRLINYFRDWYQLMHDDLINSKNFDSHLSGTTICSVLFDAKMLFCVNAGDSRAVLYSQGKKGIKSTPLSDDHKPGLPNEKKRIEAMNGRVCPI